MERRRIVLTVAFSLLAVLVLVAAQRGGMLHASVQDGLDLIKGSVDIPTGDPRDEVTRAVRFVVTFLALAAVITIITAGFFFVVGLGTDTAIQRGKKIILYTILGLIIVFFARLIVGFLTKELPS